MLRRQWPLIVLLALIGSFIAVGVAIAVWPRDDGPFGSGPKLHPPASTDERASAGAGIVYLRALQHRDAAAACRIAGDGLARRLRCESARPRIPRALRQPPGRLRAIDADVDGADAGIAICGGACVNFLSLRRSPWGWRVIAHRLGGYA